MLKYCELENPSFFEKYICIFLNKNNWNKVEPEYWFKDKNENKHYKVKDLLTLLRTLLEAVLQRLISNFHHHLDK